MVLAGCGDSKGGSDASTGSTGAAMSTGSGPTEASAGSSTQAMTGTGDATTGSEMVVCTPELTCTDEVCVEDVLEPACSFPAPGDPCPRGTTPAQCGGDGQDCCCGPTPPPAFTCAPATGCPGAPACDCLTMICGPDKECSQPDPLVAHFVCVPLPKP